MKDRSDCWLTFTEALEMYLTARAERIDAPVGSHRWEQAQEEMRVAGQHMDILTSALPAVAAPTASLAPAGPGLTQPDRPHARPRP